MSKSALTLEEAGTATVSGHVYWPGSPGGSPRSRRLKGIPVHFSWAASQIHAMTTADASGTYSIELQPGDYVVIAGHADRSVHEQRLTLKAGDAIKLDLPVSPATGLF